MKKLFGLAVAFLCLAVSAQAADVNDHIRAVIATLKLEENV